MPPAADRPDRVPANLAPDAFRGTAEAYAQFRPPYPKSMLDELLAHARITPPGHALLDLATGPGRIALDLAPSFDLVVAIDLEPDMIAVGRSAAQSRGLQNITWHVGRAEDLEAGDESFDLITIGEAFHRLDQVVIARKAMRWLRPGGCLATLGTDGRFAGDEPWEAAVRELLATWINRAFPDGHGLVLPGGSDGDDGRARVLRDAGFGDIESRGFDFRWTLTIDSIVGYLESTSTCSRRALGTGFAAFAAEVRSALGGDSTTVFAETIRVGYTLARKPG